jgi:peptide/nickel transport system permease protein
MSTSMMAAPEAVPQAVPVVSARRRRLRQAVRRPSSVAGLAFLALLVLAALLGSLVAPYGASQLDLKHQLAAPDASHWFGTDDLGRDVFSRVVVGARYSVLSIAAVLSLALLIGTVVGAAAGYLGGLVDEALMRVTDVFLSFPSLVLALAIAAALGRTLTSAIFAIALVWWPGYARLVRGQVLSVKGNEYVDAARALGVSRARILVQHVLPNSMAPVLVQLSLDMGNVLVTFAGLSFLGLGAPPGTPEWGALVNDGQQYLLSSWWFSTLPGLVLFVTALNLNFIGEMVQQILAPGRRQQA